MILKNVPLSSNISLDGDCIPMQWIEIKELADVILDGKWSWYNVGRFQDGESQNLNIQIEDGFTAKWQGYWKWISESTQRDPTSCYGDFSLILPNEGTPCAKNFDDIKADSIFKQTIIAPKEGLEVKDGKIIKGSGNDSRSQSISVTFLKRWYFGYVTSENITESVIKSLSKSGLSTSRSLQQSGVSAGISEYTVYAYPSSLGNLTSIIQDNVTQIIGAFRKYENTIDITNSAGKTISYNVYISNRLGAFNNSTLNFN